MINQGTAGAVRSRTAVEAVVHNLESWWRDTIVDLAPDWSGDARFHLGRARRALDHGDVAQAQREATRALELDPVSPWALVVLGRCALTQSRPLDAIQAFSRACNRSPGNRYIVALLARAESAASLAEGT